MTELDKKLAAARSKMEQSSQRRQQTPPIGGVVVEHESAHRSDPSDEQRRARTHRLVQLGALAEKYLIMQGLQLSEAEQLLKRLVESSEVKRIIGGGK